MDDYSRAKLSIYYGGEGDWLPIQNIDLDATTAKRALHFASDQPVECKRWHDGFFGMIRKIRWELSYKYTLSVRAPITLSSQKHVALPEWIGRIAGQPFVTFHSRSPRNGPTKTSVILFEIMARESAEDGSPRYELTLLDAVTSTHLPDRASEKVAKPVKKAYSRILKTLPSIVARLVNRNQSVFNDFDTDGLFDKLNPRCQTANPVFSDDAVKSLFTLSSDNGFLYSVADGQVLRTKEHVFPNGISPLGQTIYGIDYTLLFTAP